MCQTAFKILCFTGLLAVAAPAVAVDLQLTKISSRGQVIDIRHAGDGSSRLFLAEQAGRVRIIRDGIELNSPFLDINERLSTGGERGLLSLAFAPDHAQSGLFYVWYSDQSGDMVLSRFSTGPDPDLADANSEQILLKVEQPFSNHNGGRLQFDPDGFLYLGIGDGGGGGDPQGHGQNITSLLGSMIRIDVDPVHGGYAIPPDNPYVAAPGADEIWAWGLRNPWRSSFDRLTGDLYIADVGQGQREEINFQPAASRGGENYGWNIMEGSTCFGGGNCNMQNLTLPVAEYDHGLGCSVTGGEIYRGNAYPALQGVYLYGDFCSGRIWGLLRSDGEWQSELLANTALNILTFGEGEDGSLYLAAQGDGVYLLSDGAVKVEPAFTINAGLNDAWFNPDTTGQGFFIMVFPTIGKIFLAWFTFDTVRPDDTVPALLGEAGHRWVTAFGDYDGTQAVLDIELTEGGIFDAVFPQPLQSAYGTITLRFTGCTAGVVTYQFPALNLDGQVVIQRLANDNVALCETLAAAD